MFKNKIWLLVLSFFFPGSLSTITFRATATIDADDEDFHEVYNDIAFDSAFPHQPQTPATTPKSTVPPFFETPTSSSTSEREGRGRNVAIRGRRNVARRGGHNVARRGGIIMPQVARITPEPQEPSDLSQSFSAESLEVLRFFTKVEKRKQRYVLKQLFYPVVVADLI